MTETTEPPSQHPSAGSHKSSDLMIEQLVSIEKISLNVTQSVIVTTEDKLKLCLQKYISDTERSREWVAPLSLFVGLILALVTADFRNVILSASTWNALFIIFSGGSFIWLLISLKRALANRSINSLIAEIKSETVNKNLNPGDSHGS